MKTINITILTILAFVSSEIFAANSAITPPSAGGTGLVRSQRDAAYKVDGNLYITGNVTGGKQFRGFVPYRSTSDFSGALGSSSLDTFRKESSGIPTTTSRPGQTQPYYSPTRTVTWMQNRRIEGVRDTTQYQLQGFTDLPAQQSQPITRELSKPIVKNYAAPLVQPKVRPLSKTGIEITDGFRKDLYNISIEKEQIEKAKPVIEEQQREDLTDIEKNLQKPVEPQKAPEVDKFRDRPVEKVEADRLRYRKSEDVFDKIKESLLKKEDKGEKAAKDEAEAAEEEKPKTTKDLISSTLQVEKPEKPSYGSEAAEEIRGKHKTFASYANDKYNNYMQLAEDYLHEGLYYKASDAYDLASMFKPDDPLPYAGQSLALFAAGEYMSSSFYLQKAIQIFPMFPRVEIDTTAFIDDKDTIENRILDAKTWQERSKSSELAILLSYIYLQMGQYDWAQEQLDKAKDVLGETEAISSIGKAIEIRKQK